MTDCVTLNLTGTLSPCSDPVITIVPPVVRVLHYPLLGDIVMARVLTFNTSVRELVVHCCRRPTGTDLEKLTMLAVVGQVYVFSCDDDPESRFTVTAIALDFKGRVLTHISADARDVQGKEL
jgi:hypothetical protein